jgi:ABC-type dipeptide/oligopeptide/nickel transport system ATPase component
LLHRPAILIADEPTSALDPVTQSEIVKLLRRLNQQSGTALLYISHDLVSVLQLCDRMAVLHSGSIVECLRVDEIENALHEATLSLLGSLPVPAHVLLQHREANLRTRSGGADASGVGPYWQNLESARPGTGDLWTAATAVDDRPETYESAAWM